MITMENHEGWLMRYADGALTHEEREAVEAFLALHPELREEMEEVAAVKVTPVVSTMPGKERMLHKEAVGFAWWRVAAAVALLAVAVSTLTVLNRQDGEQPLMAENKGVEKIDLIETIEAIDTTEAIDSVTIQPIHPVKSKKTIVTIPSIKESPQLMVQAEEPAATIEEEDTVVPAESTPRPTIKITYGRVINDAHLAVNVWRDNFLATN